MKTTKWCSSWVATRKMFAAVLAAKWRGVGTAHVDAVQRLDAIDGYEVSLREVGGGDRTKLDSTYEPSGAP